MRLLILLAPLVFALAQNPTIRHAEGKALKAKGDAPGALAVFEKAAAEQPAAAKLQDEIGFLLAVLGRHQDAMVRFDRAIALDGTYAPAHYHLAMAAWHGKNLNRRLNQVAIPLFASIDRLGLQTGLPGHVPELHTDLDSAEQLIEGEYGCGSAQGLQESTASIASHRSIILARHGLWQTPAASARRTLDIHVHVLLLR